MALSDRHWIMGTLLACGAIAALELPPTEDAPPSRRTSPISKEIRARDRLATHLRRETATLALLERRDALMRRLGNTDGHGAPIVFHDADIPVFLRQLIDSAIAREVAGVGGRLDAGRVAVRVLADTGAPPAHWGPLYGAAAWIENQYVLPPATDGRTCLAIVRIGPRVLDDIDPARGRVPASAPARTVGGLRRTMDQQAGQFLGPCAYYGAHGLPGPHVKAWLAGTHFDPALRAPAMAADSVRGFLFRSRTTMVERWIQNVGWRENRPYLHPDLVRCAEGDRAGCAGSLHAPRSETGPRASPWLLRDSGTRFAIGLPLGPSESWLLAGLHERMGPEAFGRFWRSPLAPEEAFAEMMDVTLTDATVEWVSEIYDAGPSRAWPHPLAFAGQILLMGGLVGTAALRRKR